MRSALRITVAILLAMLLPGAAQADKILGSGVASLTDPAGFVATTSWQSPPGSGVPIGLQYSFSNLLDGGITGLSAAQIRSDVEQSLTIVAAHVPINFVEVVDAGPAPSDVEYGNAGTTPHLRFGHHGIDGAGNTLAHAFFPPGGGNLGLGGDVHMDNGENWASAGFFLEVFLHELGHGLGLGHEDTVFSAAVPSAFNANPPAGTALPIMCATCFHQGSPGFADGGFLYQDDINGLQNLYGQGAGSVTPLSPQQMVPEPSSIAIWAAGAGFIALFIRRRARKHRRAA